MKFCSKGCALVRCDLGIWCVSNLDMVRATAEDLAMRLI